jgi:outer membrane protein
MKVDEAKAKSSEVNAARLPSISLSGGYVRLSEITPFEVTLPGSSRSLALLPNIPNVYAGKLTVQQPLFTGLRLEKTASALHHDVLASKLDHETAARNLRFEITNAYWNLVKANDFRTIIDEDVKRQETHLQDAQNLFDQGIINRNDVLRVEVQHSNALLQQIGAHNGVELAKSYLESVIGAPLEGDIDLTSPPDSLKPVDGLSMLRQMAFASRSELRAMEHRVEMGKAGVAIAKSDWLPQVALVGNYTYSRPNQRIQPIEDKFENTWDVGVYVTYNLWDWWGTGHKAQAAKSQLAQVEDAKRQLEDGIALQVSQDYLNLQQNIERIRVSQTSLDQANEGYRITHDQYQEGIARTSDLLDASLLQLQARVNYSQALVDYRVAKARLEATIGK